MFVNQHFYELKKIKESLKKYGYVYIIKTKVFMKIINW